MLVGQSLMQQYTATPLNSGHLGDINMSFIQWCLLSLRTVVATQYYRDGHAIIYLAS